MLFAIIYQELGMNPLAPGAHVVQALAEKFDQLFSSSTANWGKECNCVLQLLYNFRRSKMFLFTDTSSASHTSTQPLPPSIPSFSPSISLPLPLPSSLFHTLFLSYPKTGASFSETAIDLLLLLLKSQCWFSSCHMMLCYYHVTVMRSASGDPAMLLPLQTQAWR